MGVVHFLLHIVLCSAALTLSGYALYVEVAKERDEDFEALCDISPQVSCSTVLTSRYSKGFGFLGTLLGEDHPLNTYNSVYGLLYYTFIFVLGLWRSSLSLGFVLFMESVGCLNFLFLGYIMFFILHDTCLLCLSLYAVHLLLLLLHSHQWFTLPMEKQKRE